MTNILNDVQKNILCGMMLGDGCLHRRVEWENANAYLITNHKIEDKEYVWWLYDNFKEFCNREPYTKKWFDDREGFNKEFVQETFLTKCLPIFTEVYNKWYINSKKILPSDFGLNDLNKQCLLIWFLDDGTCYYNDKKPQNLEVRLNTHGFSKDDVEKLRILLCKKIGQMFTLGTAKKHPDQYIIIGSNAAARAFFKMIDNITIPAMTRKYKWRDECCYFYDENYTPKMSRNLFIFEKEYSILKAFYDKKQLTISEISNFCNWKLNNKYNKIATRQISRYLECYEKNFLIKKTEKFVIKKGRLFEITEKGIKYFEKIFKDQNINDLMYEYKPLAKTKNGPK